jgi:exopolysaccharide biosynthesis polyprenyl glycosylphosphotransferase
MYCICDLAVIIVSGFVLFQALALPGSELGAAQILALASLSAALALAYYQMTAPAASREGEMVLHTAIRASLSTMAAVCSVLLISAVLLPASARADLGHWAMYWAPTATLLTGAIHYIAGSAAANVGKAALRAVLVCAADRAEGLARLVSGMRGWVWLTSCNSDNDNGVATLATLAQHRLLDVVVLDVQSMDRTRIREICYSLAETPVRICLGFETGSLSVLLSDSSLILTDLVVSPLQPAQAALKRATDIVFSSLALLLLSPLLLVGAAAVRYETKGGVLFRQWRTGQGGRPFQALKLRTMYSDVCDGSGEKQTSPNDPRITRVGRFLRRTSIDELPQLINVLKGDMSLVGPRAHPIRMTVEGLEYSEAVKIYRIRHRVKPGITGWAQVNGSRGAINTIVGAQRRLELDLFYIQNWSIFLDFAIVLRTICGGFIAEDE